MQANRCHAAGPPVKSRKWKFPKMWRLKLCSELPEIRKQVFGTDVAVSSTAG
jgi:hypothetical protein